jgi:3-oxoacyl-[acyl-carrier-protein] synthase-3
MNNTRSYQRTKFKAKIHAVGTYIPEAKESNYDLINKFNIERDFIDNKIGIIERAIKENKENTSDLCCYAFNSLCSKITLEFSKIKLICVVTQNPDYKIPYTAAIVHNKLGFPKECMTFDLSHGCAGYVHAIALISAFMERYTIGQALIFTCDPYSQIVDHNSKNESLLFGDAATVSLLCLQGNGYELIDTDFGTVPNSYSCLILETVLKMQSYHVFAHAINEVPNSIMRLIQKNSLTQDTIDLIILHQASKYIIEVIKNKLGLCEKKIPFMAKNYGNTISSSIPIILADYLEQDLMKDSIILSGFGVGFSWGSALLKYFNEKNES